MNGRDLEVKVAALTKDLESTRAERDKHYKENTDLKEQVSCKICQSELLVFIGEYIQLNTVSLSLQYLHLICPLQIQKVASKCRTDGKVRVSLAAFLCDSQDYLLQSSGDFLHALYRQLLSSSTLSPTIDLSSVQNWEELSRLVSEQASLVISQLQRSREKVCLAQHFIIISQSFLFNSCSITRVSSAAKTKQLLSCSRLMKIS
jgi:hypothetical protein